MLLFDVFQGDSGAHKWFATLPVEGNPPVFVSWGHSLCILLPWQTFTARWNHFCLPSSDDVFVFPQELAWVLFFSHEEEFQLGVVSDTSGVA